MAETCPGFESVGVGSFECRQVFWVAELLTELSAPYHALRARAPENFIQPVVFPGDLVGFKIPLPDAQFGGLGREPQPLFGKSLAYRIVDAKTGQIEAGELPVGELRTRQPWRAAAA